MAVNGMVKRIRKYKTPLAVVLLPLWVYAMFWAAQLAVELVVYVLVLLRVPLTSIHPTALTTILSAVIYIVAFGLVVWLPWAVRRSRTTLRQLGVANWPEVLDVLLAPATFVLYVIASALLLATLASILPIDVAQRQALPFDPSQFMLPWERMLAFFTLVVVAPLAEELLFRGYLYGKLRSRARAVVAIILTGLAFGLAHAWGGLGAPLQWAVVIDTFALGLFLSGLREYTGAIWAGLLVHMIKNGIAFYFLFINPYSLDQLKAGLLLL
ncbi:MAG: CPBP family intramembrane metalloprotease [Candidatus Saccharibacteria bacterium]|nr:CPBP family intramembrane metalloprotease [Candidatus Saccharibacteria bacterium]